MLKLIGALADFNGPTYDGCVMAKAALKIENLDNAGYATRPIKMAPPRMGVIEAYKEGAASLTVTLLRPLVRAGEMPEVVPQGEKLLSFVIDKDEINAYLDAVNDTNSIHRGDNPVVPGLCMIEHLWRALNKPQMVDLLMVHGVYPGFLLFGYGGETIDVYKNGEALDGYCGGRELFSIAVKGR